MDHSRSHQQWVLTDDRVIEYVRQTRFFITSQLSWVRHDWPLLTVLIEILRSETFTFHLRVGEMNITLQDGTMLLGLIKDDPHVIGTKDKDWVVERERLLNREPPLMVMRVER